MSKPRVNEPCPCGSGKKYKLCCRSSGGTKTMPSSTSNVDSLVDAATESYSKGRLVYSRKLCEKVLCIEPHHERILRLKAEILIQQGKLSNSLAIYTDLVKRNPGNQDLMIKLAHVYRKMGGYQHAIAAYQAAVKTGGWNRCLYESMGDVYHKMGDYAGAISVYEKAIDSDPEDAVVHNALGAVFLGAYRYDEAISCFEKAREIKPSLIRAHNNLGCALQANGDFDGARQAFGDALRIAPRYVASICNLAGLYKNQGCLEKAVKMLKLAHDAEPDNKVIQGNYLASLNYSDTITRKKIYEEHCRIGRKLEQEATRIFQDRRLSGDPESRLRIGYLSPDFNDHAVAAFVLPVLRSHNRREVIVYCYYNRNPTDDITEEIRKLSDYWRPIASMNDATVAHIIQQDGIDILVDLAGYTAGNRLGVFAQKPAPIQVAWIGYPNTTGLTTMDYRITDMYTDPPGETESYYTETLVRMPGLFSVFNPPSVCPSVAEPPVLRNGCVTFGCFNNIAKISDSVIGTWSNLLHEAQNTRLMLKYQGLDSASFQSLLLSRFMENGIHSDRIVLRGGDDSRYEHLQRYSEIDVALDVFPYNGTTTTCEALWMGVPVVGLIGNSHISRVTYSILKNLGLGRIAGRTQQEYVEIALGLATDAGGLKSLRARLREDMMGSSITDSLNFTKLLESKFKGMRNAVLGKEP